MIAQIQPRVRPVRHDTLHPEGPGEVAGPCTHHTNGCYEKVLPIRCGTGSYSHPGTQLLYSADSPTCGPFANGYSLEGSLFFCYVKGKQIQRATSMEEYHALAVAAVEALQAANQPKWTEWVAAGVGIIQCGLIAWGLLLMSRAGRRRDRQLDQQDRRLDALLERSV